MTRVLSALIAVRLRRFCTFLQLNELDVKLCLDEGLDGGRPLVGIGRLRQRSADDLVDDVASVLVLGLELLRPEVSVLPLHEVAGLQMEVTVSVGDSTNCSS